MHRPDEHSKGWPGSCRPVPQRSYRVGGNSSRPPRPRYPPPSRWRSTARAAVSSRSRG